MKYDIFENENKAEARKALQQLVTEPGWKLIEKAIDANIEYFTDHQRNRIEVKRDFKNLEELYALQDRIDDLRALKDLPKELFDAAQDDEEEEDEDPFES